MIEGRKVLALIPARGGSKGIPGKNIHPVGGRPLLAWSIDVARQSRYIDRTIVSTDDPRIAAIARELGAEIPFMRPEELARDDTPGMAPVMHALANIPGFDVLVLLQPTSPLRTAADVDGAIEKVVLAGSPACVSVSEAENHPYWTYRMDAKGCLTPFLEVPEDRFSRRQDLPPAFTLNGAVYAANIAWLNRTGTFLSKETAGLAMPAERSIDVDTIEDIERVEEIIRRREGRRNDV